MEAKATYKLNKKIKDDTFNVDLIFQYNLFLQINNNLFRLCITDSESHRCLLLEDYQLFAINSESQLIDLLEQIYDNHHILKAGFWKSIKVAIKTTNFSLIPNSLFDKQYLRDYLSINCTITNENIDNIIYYKQNSTDAVNIFSVNKGLVEYFNNAYRAKSITYVHHTTPFIEGVMIHSTPPAEAKSMYIQVENNHLTILVRKKKNLEFCNTFYFRTPEDFVYFVMFVFDQLKLNPENTGVTLWGEINPDSPIYNKLSKYIRNVSFGDKPSSIYFGYNFDEVFDHRFFDLYSMHFCQ